MQAPGQLYPGQYAAFVATGGDHQIAPAGFANAQAFGQVAVNGQIGPAGFANQQAFGVPAVQARISPTGFANTTAFEVPALNGRIAPAGFANAPAFGVPGVDGRIEPSGFANTPAFGQPTVGDHTITTAGFANVTAFGRPTIEPTVEARPIDGSGLIVTSRRKRRQVRPRDRDRLPEDIAREQREEERYLAELEKKKQVAPTVVPKADEPEVAVPVVAQLPDALARAVSAEQVIARARASSAEAIARSKAEEKRRTALLLLALD